MFQKFFNPFKPVYDASIKDETLSVLRYGQVYATYKLNASYVVVTAIPGTGDQWLNKNVPEWAKQLQMYAAIVVNHNVSDRTTILREFYRTYIQALNKKNAEVKGRK